MKSNFTSERSGYRSIFKKLSLFLLAGLLFFSHQIFGQAANIDQVRNGPANNPQKNFYATFPNPEWVNGNAGASNAHYVEGMSIGYRSLITGVVNGDSYEYTIEYDTKHSDAMAIDYLTHYQRLEPHQPFGHPAETLDPRIFKSGSTEYLIGVVSTDDYPIPAPFQAPANTPVAGMPQNSFNALPAPERLMTILNGEILDISYVTQESLTNGTSKSSTSVKIRFRADDDSVVLAWGGHIGSRLDWGYTDPPANTIPRSAGGISGSPYHMRHVSMNTYPGLVNISLGNQDRSLSAAAVVPPPLCPTVASQSKCLESTSYTFTISNPDAQTTYTWSLGTNNVDAAISGSNQGTSVTVIHSGGGSFTTGGTFTLNISALKNGITVECPGVATGTVVKVVATATASPTSIDIRTAGHNTTLTAVIGASSTYTDNALYTYAWSIVGTAAGSLTNADQRIATYTAAPEDASQTINFKVVVTQIAAPTCTTEATVGVPVGSVGECTVSAQGPVCQGATTTHNANAIEGGATYTWTVLPYPGQLTTTATLASGQGTASVTVNATQSYRIEVSQVYPNTAVNTSCGQDVVVVPGPTVAATYVAPTTCDATTYSLQVTGAGGAATEATSTYTVTQTTATPPYSDSKAGNGGTLVFTGLTQGIGYTVTVVTGVAACTGTATCGAANDRLVSGNRTTTSQTGTVESFKITLDAPAATESTMARATPNPFTDKVRFNLVSAVSGNGTLELYNTLGQKVTTVFTGYVQAGVELQKEYNVPASQRNTLIYVFRVGNQRATGKLLRQQSR